MASIELITLSIFRVKTMKHRVQFLESIRSTLYIVTVTARHRGMGTGISEASKRVPIFSFATQGGKQVSSHFRQGN